LASEEICILFIADIVGKAGRKALQGLLPGLIQEYQASLVVANGENAAGGFGLTREVLDEIHAAGVSVVTSGNHVWDKKEALSLLGQEPNLLRPANYPVGVPGRGGLVVQARGGHKIGILNLMGRVFMAPLDDPFRTADLEIERMQQETEIILVDFHAEATAEKIAMGWYLDGRVSAVIGTHTHVQTADEHLLPEGTAYVTDVGMTGPFDSVIGMKKEGSLKRFLTGIPVKFEAAGDDIWLSGAWVKVDLATGHATGIGRIQREWKG
jgi:metallophosphoesterase (TIGR00282 family)